MTDRSHLLTELRLPESMNLDAMSVEEAVAVMNEQDARAVAAVKAESTNVAKAVELAAAPSGDRVLGTDPTTGYDVVARAGRYGPYVSLTMPEGSAGKSGTAKPPTASLFKTMDLETLTLEQALRLLTLPRVLGTAEDGEEITAKKRPLEPAKAEPK